MWSLRVWGPMVWVMLRSFGFQGSRAVMSCYPFWGRPVKHEKQNQALSLGHFQVGSYRYRSLIEGLYTPYTSRIEALYYLP